MDWNTLHAHHFRREAVTTSLRGRIHAVDTPGPSVGPVGCPGWSSSPVLNKFFQVYPPFHAPHNETLETGSQPFFPFFFSY